MQNYTYQNDRIGKKQLRQLLAWSFTNYDSMQSCFLADELKYLGFKYASQAGISISLEDLKVPFVKNLMIDRANKEIRNAEKVYLKGKITEIERFQKIIDTWSLTSESLKDQVVYYFKNYDPLNSVYIMAFSGARGNLSQVRQLVGMRGLMSDPSGEIMKLPITNNFREGLTITDYLMSGYGARKGIVDTALKTANSGYLTRRLIDVAQDILIREKDCLTTHSFLLRASSMNVKKKSLVYDKILGRILSKSVYDSRREITYAKANRQVTSDLVQEFKNKQIGKFYIRSPLTCNLYRAICQKCYGWDLANENLVDIGEAVGILAGQSIGEPGTQLTMRTFHTGGVFTSEAREQIVSPVNGIVKCNKNLQMLVLRTNRGEDVFITKNSGYLMIVSDSKEQNLIRIEISKNTILFPKNNQYILKDSVIGELINIDKQVKLETQPILTDKCGEIFMPRLKKKINILNNNKLIWILSGQLYKGPNRSFINFHSDYKISKYSSIFRTKIVNHYNGFMEFCNKKSELYEQIIQVKSNKYFLLNSKFQKLIKSYNNIEYLISFKDLKYSLKIKIRNSKFYLQVARNKQLGTLITNSFRTLTGGIVYYDSKNLNKFDYDKLNKDVIYSNQIYVIRNCKTLAFHRTIIWLGEEIHKVRCESHILLVERGDFIAEGFEIIPGLFSKTSGMVSIVQQSNLIQIISIKPGFLYIGKKLKAASRKLYYPGETIFSNIFIKVLSFCEHICEKSTERLLVRPIEIYEFPHQTLFQASFKKSVHLDPDFQLNSNITCLYKPSQIIKGNQNLDLASNFLEFKTNKLSKKKTYIELKNDKNTNSINFQISERLLLNNYISPYLKYKNLHSCLLIQQNQFIDPYTILGYLEAITLTSLEIVKFRIKQHADKQILLISNLDCSTAEKNKFSDKKLNDFIVNNLNVNETGQIIIENNNFVTIQRGKPYFFPNCKKNNLTDKTDLQYKLISPTRIQSMSKINQKILLNYQNSSKFSTEKKTNILINTTSTKSEFSKLFLKKNGKLYSSLMPRFSKRFSVCNQRSILKTGRIFQPQNLNNVTFKKWNRTLLLQSNEPIKNPYKQSKDFDHQLTLLTLFENNDFTKVKKIVGLYAITEDYFEQDANNVFCKNSAFVEEGETLGLLNLEKEITGDIVQGLPRIEEILEARKKNLMIKRIPTSKKKGLLVQKTSLDPNFEFRRLGTSIKESDRINPHKLLRVYFNYYGLTKSFRCCKTQVITYNRLMSNYEGSYKSFKKIQSFILDSVQSVYQSQGVGINDKHLEVIIKQMTTKVLITYEGNTPLLRREVLDLYHIQYINQIVKAQDKKIAYYVPLLLGITKAALNNPSFISAASFQETTRVLTKAAIEGRIDWLRGLKENIIIGHLIPAGTGSQNYRNCFKKHYLSNDIQTQLINK